MTAILKGGVGSRCEYVSSVRSDAKLERRLRVECGSILPDVVPGHVGSNVEETGEIDREALPFRDQARGYVEEVSRSRLARPCH